MMSAYDYQVNELAVDSESLFREFRIEFPKKINLDNIHEAVIAAMLILSKYKALRGSEKKDFVIDIIQKANTRDEWDYVVPAVVEAVWFASNHRKEIAIIGKTIKRRCC